MHLRGRLANQVAICIERTEKALFVKPEVRFHPLKSVDGDKEGIFNRSVIFPRLSLLPELAAHRLKSTQYSGTTAVSAMFHFAQCRKVSEGRHRRKRNATKPNNAW